MRSQFKARGIASEVKLAKGRINANLIDKVSCRAFNLHIFYFEQKRQTLSLTLSFPRSPECNL
ncbi:hypothetical protein DP113_34230 (plasmid) [Brasilonema octagenarum UFV-E1]|uniref:Uncharacterized protein n=2 Tax=Brasilonema TaxID=383614 RepID=A0A856MSZ7_9CYAN|nr:hypothetical protein [Brasilonema octagenarum UFV-OR1]QDL12781.1 hypothetical protein DP114_34120 [Brasilonema sennae CENA114]QDL19177.1 hypothetical protein DP113_34230 [Brasilonema octagenarum UFV-E1]